MVAEEISQVNRTKMDVEGNFLAKKQRFGNDILEYIPALMGTRTKRPYATIPGPKAVESLKIRIQKKKRVSLKTSYVD